MAHPASAESLPRADERRKGESIKPMTWFLIRHTSHLLDISHVSSRPNTPKPLEDERRGLFVVLRIRTAVQLTSSSPTDIELLVPG